MKARCLLIVGCCFLWMLVPTMLGYGPWSGITLPGTGIGSGTYGNVLVCKGTARAIIPSYCLPRMVAKGWKLCTR